MADVRGAVSKKVIDSTGTVDLTISGFGSVSQVKGLICWYTTFLEDQRYRPGGSPSTLADGQFHVYFAQADASAASGDGALMGQGMVNENGLGTSDCYKYTDAGQGPGELRGFQIDESFSFAADTRYVLDPAIGGTQKSGPINNGWRLNVTTLEYPSIFLYYALIGGDDVEVVVKNTTINNSVGTQVSNHGLTDPVKVLCLLHTTGRETAGGTFENAIRNGLGAFYWDGTNITQASHWIRSINGDALPSFQNTSSRTRVIKYLEGATDWEVSVSAFDSTTITMQTISALGSATNEECGTMFISLPEDSDGWVGSFNMPTSAGTFTPAEQPPFSPLMYGLVATGHTDYHLEQKDQPYYGSLSYGIIDKNLNQGCVGFIQDGDVGTGDTTSTSIATPKLVHSYYEDANAGVSDPTLMADIQVTVNPFSASGVSFDQNDVAGTFGGIAWAWAFKDGQPDIELPKIDGICTSPDCVLTGDTTCIDDLLGQGTYLFQWLRDGVPIEGATSQNYTLTDDDIGATITLRITFTDKNGKTVSVVTDATRTITEPTRIGLTTPQGDIDTRGGRASPEVQQWMSNVSQHVTEAQRSGGTDERPTDNLYPGRTYFDVTLNMPIYWSNGVWYDSMGNAV